jgi:hypothetical protein
MRSAAACFRCIVDGAALALLGRPVESPPTDRELESSSMAISRSRIIYLVIY